MLLVSAALAACGAQAATATTSRASTAVPGSSGEVLYVVHGSAGASGSGYSQSLGIVAVSAGAAARAPLLSLPLGLTTLDHQRLYAATSAGGRTTIAAYDTRTGARRDAFDIVGSYGMAAHTGYTGAVLSPDGRWLALRATSTSASATTFALVDTQARRLAQTVALPGSFDLDAISPGGGMLYLLQYVNDAEHHYYVRAYDLHAQHLLDAIIVDKTELDETKMQGTAVARQMASDGRVAYTLYINPAQNHAFVHILPLGENANDVLPFARCLDLPAGSAPDLLHFYTLALAPDGATLYAANAALGLVSTISLHGQDIYSDQVERTGHFSPAAAGAATSDAVRSLYGGATLAVDQRMLYVVGLHGIWALRTSDLSPQQVYAAQQPFTGVALSADGGRLYAVSPQSGILLIPLAGGGTPHAIQAPIGSPWGIAWIAA
jgi:DNA-binding beta-propeller fold protein YncE